MRRPWLTIGVLQWSRLDWLDACLRHIAAQTCRDFEVIIGDDGFREENPAGGATMADTLEVVRQYDLPALTYRRRANDEQPSIGHNTARIVERARGEYVWLLGADDLLYPHAVQVAKHAICSAGTDLSAYVNHDIWLPDAAPGKDDTLAPTDRRMAVAGPTMLSLSDLVGEVSDAVSALYALLCPRSVCQAAYEEQAARPFHFADARLVTPLATHIVEAHGPAWPMVVVREPLMLSSHRVTWAADPTASQWDKNWYARRLQEMAAS